MKRIFLGLLAGFLLALGQPVLANPEVDAQFIASSLVRRDAFHQVMRDRMAAAAAGKLNQTLSQRSVRLRDPDRLIALMPDLFTAEVADRIETRLTEGLRQRLTPDDLAALAGYFLQVSIAPSVADPSAQATAPATLLEQLQVATDAVEAMTTPLETAKMTAGAILLGIIVAEQHRFQPDLRADLVADILAVNGVFEFPNRIVRQDMIREYRAAAP